jgi:hypothetical protein
MYEGFVTHEDGTVVNGDTELTFSLYDQDSDAPALYQETQTVYVAFGNVSTEIGIVTPLDLSLFRDNTDLFVGVAVENEPELSPRLRLRARPYAASAAYAGDALALQGLDPADLMIGATPPAANVTYDNTDTDLEATTSQDAIRALLARIQALETVTAELLEGEQCAAGQVLIRATETGSFCIDEEPRTDSNSWHAQVNCQILGAHVCGRAQTAAAYRSGRILAATDPQGEWAGFIGMYPGSWGDDVQCTGPTMWSFTYDAAGIRTLRLDCVDYDRSAGHIDCSTAGESCAQYRCCR